MKKFIVGIIAFTSIVILSACSIDIGPAPVPVCAVGTYWCGDNAGDGECIDNADDCCNSFGDFCQYPSVCCGFNVCC